MSINKPSQYTYSVGYIGYGIILTVSVYIVAWTCYYVYTYTNTAFKLKQDDFTKPFIIWSTLKPILTLLCVLCMVFSMYDGLSLFVLAIATGVIFLGSFSFVVKLLVDRFTSCNTLSHPHNFCNDPLYCCVYYDDVPDCYGFGPCANITSSHDLHVSEDFWTLALFNGIFIFLEFLLIAFTFAILMKEKSLFYSAEELLRIENGTDEFYEELIEKSKEVTESRRINTEEQEEEKEKDEEEEEEGNEEVKEKEGSNEPDQKQDQSLKIGASSMHSVQTFIDKSTKYKIKNDDKVDESADIVLKRKTRKGKRGDRIKTKKTRLRRRQQLQQQDFVGVPIDECNDYIHEPNNQPIQSSILNFCKRNTNNKARAEQEPSISTYVNPQHLHKMKSVFRVLKDKITTAYTNLKECIYLFTLHSRFYFKCHVIIELFHKKKTDVVKLITKANSKQNKINTKI